MLARPTSQHIRARQWPAGPCEVETWNSQVKGPSPIVIEEKLITVDIGDDRLVAKRNREHITARRA
jgi:hypothetical protein